MVLSRRRSAAAAPKIFGIGFHKTGTTSLGAALERLGYRVCGPVGVRDPRIAERVWKRAQRELPRYDAFQDNPWPLLYRELDRACPGSRFILTERPSERWIASAVAHFGTLDTPMREWIYGRGRGHPEGNEDVYRARYEAHGRAVREYFASRPDDLLVMDLSAGDGWEKLAGFLGCEAPDEPFPHRNPRRRREPRPGAGVPWKRWRRAASRPLGGA